MAVYALGDRVPDIHPSAFVHPDATVIGAVAKGEALTSLVAKLKPRSVFLLGDDVSDAMAFRALHKLRDAGTTDGVAVAIQARAEVPTEVLASADIVLASPVDATRFLAALGAESLKVEWKENPDTRMAAMAPVGGREARRAATAPLKGVTDPDMGGQFNNKNSGKRGISFNIRDPRGLEIAKD